MVEPSPTSPGSRADQATGELVRYGEWSVMSLLADIVGIEDLKPQPTATRSLAYILRSSLDLVASLPDVEFELGRVEIERKLGGGAIPDLTIFDRIQAWRPETVAAATGRSHRAVILRRRELHRESEWHGHYLGHAPALGRLRWGLLPWCTVSHRRATTEMDGAARMVTGRAHDPCDRRDLAEARCQSRADRSLQHQRLRAWWRDVRTTHGQRGGPAEAIGEGEGCRARDRLERGGAGRSRGSVATPERAGATSAGIVGAEPSRVRSVDDPTACEWRPPVCAARVARE